MKYHYLQYYQKQKGFVQWYYSPEQSGGLRDKTRITKCIKE